MLPDESSKDYHDFLIYMYLGRYYRSLEQVRIELGRKKSYLRWLEHLSSKYQWVKRAKAHDIYLDQKSHYEFMRHLYLENLNNKIV